VTFLNPESLTHEELLEQYIILAEGFNNLFDSIQRVRELHIPNPSYIGEQIPCIFCRDEDIPCSTLKAVDGDTE